MSGSHACIDDQLDGILYHQSEFDEIDPAASSKRCGVFPLRQCHTGAAPIEPLFAGPRPRPSRSVAVI
jgi:hypothetical protein